jgi:hypothetical protein
MNKILILIAILFPFFGYSQTNLEDVVYLKNGSVIRGIITEMIPNKSVKIKSDRNVFVYKMEEIEKMTKEESDNISKTQISSKEYDINLFKDFLSDKIRNETNGLMSLIKVEKSDGETIKEMDGRDYYKLYFQLEVRAEFNLYSGHLADYQTMKYIAGPFGIVNSSFRVNTECNFPGSIFSKNTTNCDYVEKGSNIKYIGSALVLKTERNWKISNFEIKSSEVISITNIQAEELFKKQKEEQLLFEQKKEENRKINTSIINGSFEADNYKVEYHPLIKNYSIQLSDIRLVNKNISFDFSAIQMSIQKGFTTHPRIVRLYTKNDSPLVKIVIDVIDIQSKYSSGTKLFSKETYAGYEVIGDFRLRVFSSGKEIITENWQLKAGSPMSNHSESVAFGELLKNLSGSTNSIIYSLFPFSANINAITKENNKEVKRLNLSNAQLIPDNYIMYFVVVEKKDYTLLSDGRDSINNVLATLEKKGIENGEIDCKVTSGGKNLKELFVSGKEYFVISSRAKPKEVE